MKMMIYILPVVWCLVAGYFVIHGLTAPPLLLVVAAVVGVLLVGLLWCEVRDAGDFDVYDALDIFLEYNAVHTDDEMYAYTEWIQEHSDFVRKYRHQFVVLSLPDYKVLHHCTSADEFIQYLDGILPENRGGVFVYHSTLFTPKYWIA